MYAFGEFVLDPQLYQLRRADQVVPLEPKVFDVLRYLVEHSERVATKRELLDSLWPHEVVTEAVLPTNINTLRRALGQKRGEKWPIETVHGRGYRFSMPVKRSSPPPALDASSQSVPPGQPERGEPDPTYVGQTALLEKLRRVTAQVLSDHGQVCVLSGEAGIGKTRTARHLADLARAHGADVWLASCGDARETPPMWVFQQVLRCALQSDGPELLRRWLGTLASELASFLPVLSDARDAGSISVLRDQESFRMFEAVARVITQASRIRPRVLWLEDMHRADDASWQLLNMLIPHLEGTSVLVIVTVRSRDDLTVVMPMQRNLDRLQRATNCQRFALRGLSTDEVGKLAEQLLGRPVEPDFARALHDKTDGNPLFVRELLEWLEARGPIDATALRGTPNLAPPEMVRHVLRRRVVRLGAGAQRLLEVAAVAGQHWDAAIVERAAQLSHDAFCDAIDAALTSRVIVQVQGRVDCYRFTHDLLRDTLYSDLTTRERRRLHLSVAHALEQRLAWLGAEAVFQIADHWYAALPDADTERAIGWLERAAVLCEQAGAYREAARYYRSALDAARLLPVANPALAESLSVSEERLSVLARASGAQS
jgi:DNA-binding winged helix-turn-helix (wHTH) protein/predicted ATPase